MIHESKSHATPHNNGLPVKKDDLVLLTITGMTAEGAGVGRVDGLPVFVPLSAVSDSLRVRITHTAKRFAHGAIEDIVSPSADRMVSDCPVFPACGGCTYRHIAYPAELSAKQQRVYDALTRIGGIDEKDVLLHPIIASPMDHSYRNKALIPLGRNADGKLTMGFFAVNSHHIVDTPSCHLLPAEFNLVMQLFHTWCAEYPVSIYDSVNRSGILRRLYLRKAEKTGEIMVCLVVATDPIHTKEIPYLDKLLVSLQASLPNLVSVIINHNPDPQNQSLGRKSRILWGKGSIEDELCGLRFSISPLSFYQVNPKQTAVLYRKAIDYAGLTGKETVLDLYCGTGTIGLAMAHAAKKVIGVEIVEKAIEDARKNAESNGITNAEFICGDATKAAFMLKQRGESPDVVVLDPPRKGCDASLIETVAHFSPQRIVYVSCDPATLARDAKRFREFSYAVREVTPVDMFPRTSHVECVVLMSRDTGGMM